MNGCVGVTRTGLLLPFLSMKCPGSIRPCLLFTLGNPVATARASFLRGQGHHTGRDPGKEFGVDLEGGRVPAGGASEVK